MKLFYKILIMLLLLACITPFFIKGPDNRPLMTLGKLKLLNVSIPQLSSLAELKLPKVDTRGNTAIPARGETKIYKWKDKDGSWHFSDHENPYGSCEVLYLPAGDTLAGPNDATNSMGEITTGLQKHLLEIKTKISSAKIPLTRPYTNTEALIKEAQRVKKEIEDKYNQQSSLLK